jgi:hypothetical protein
VIIDLFVFLMNSIYRLSGIVFSFLLKLAFSIELFQFPQLRKDYW